MKALAITMMIAQTLIELTGPDNQVIEMNPAEIVSMRVPRHTDDHFAKGIHCIIFTSDSKYTSVQESCREVADKIRHGGK